MRTSRLFLAGACLTAAACMPINPPPLTETHPANPEASAVVLHSPSRTLEVGPDEQTKVENARITSGYHGHQESGNSEDEQPNGNHTGSHHAH